MFSPAARAGTYNAPASAHNATTEYSTRFMRIAISISPAVSRRGPSVLASFQQMHHISVLPGLPSRLLQRVIFHVVAPAYRRPVCLSEQTRLPKGGDGERG